MDPLDYDSKVLWLHNRVPQYLHQTIETWECGCLAIRLIARPFAEVLVRVANMCPKHQAKYDESRPDNVQHS